MAVEESQPAPFRLLRGTDVIDLRFSFPGLKIDKPLLGDRRLMRADPATDAWLIVVFGPQHVVERAFAAAQDDPVEPVEPHDPPPVASRISGRSVLVFDVGPGVTIDYTESGLLQAMRTLPLRVVDVARETSPAPTMIDHGSVFQSVRMVRTVAEMTGLYGQDAPRAAGLVGGEPAATVAVGPENPAAEGNLRTGIELPYRLLLSPPQTATWRHRTEPAEEERAELWHTRMRGDRARAVWTRDPGFSVEPPEPLGRDTEFRMALDPHDRSSVVHYTSNPVVMGDQIAPLRVDHLVLSTMGGWLDSLGRWPRPPVGFELTEWRHRAAMGRDHYVRVLYRGRLFPFGHEADLVKVTERAFDPERPDRAAYLNQRMFILVREPVRTYGEEVVSDESPPRLLHLLFPFRSVRLLTLATPDLMPFDQIPGLSPADGDGDPDEKFAFFPAIEPGEPFRFEVSTVDVAGRTARFRTPMAFLGKAVHENETDVQTVVAHYEQLGTEAPTEPLDVAKVVADLHGQPVAFAASAKPDDTTLSTMEIVWGAHTTSTLLDRDPTDHPRYVPTLRRAKAIVPAVQQFSFAHESDEPVSVSFPRPYAEHGFTDGNKGQVFVELHNPVDMTFSADDQTTALVQPEFQVAGLSRVSGPVAAAAQATAADEVDKWSALAQGRFNPLDYFGAFDGARLFGVFRLSEILDEVGLDQLRAPNLVTETVNAVTGFLSDLGRLRDLLRPTQVTFPEVTQSVDVLADAADSLVSAVRTFVVGRFGGDLDTAAVADVEAALHTFSAALTALTSNLPAAADPAIRDMLGRVAAQVATWDSAAGDIPSLRQAVERIAQGGALPEVVNARMEWQPDIKAWAPGGTPQTEADAVFWPRGRLSLVVDLRGSLRPDVPQAADITCSLEDFDLLLVPGFQVLRLRFERIRFTARSGRKPDIEVQFAGVDFINQLAFVQTLRDLIPLDGFSDPPAIAVGPTGVTASYSMPLPNVAVGVFSLENLALNADLEVPFSGGMLSVGFAFCRREAPFRLTVALFGGGGYFGIVLTPESIAVLEAALEFGASVSLDFGVASGSVSVMAGIYFRLGAATGEVTLAGYLRARGEVDVLGLVSASIELYLELGYEDGYMVGRASITISIEIGFFEESVEISCEKRFAGAGPAGLGAAAAPVSPPTYADLMASYDDPVTGAHRDPVFEYCTAFAEVS